MKAKCTSLRLLSLLLLLLLTWALPSSAQKRIYIAPDDHTDYMWTANEATYRQAFLDMIDYYLNLTDATIGNPVPYQSRWNCDGSFWLWTYEKNKSLTDFERLINRIRDGHFSAPLTTLVGCYGGTPAEAVLRGLYYSGRLERRYNIRFPMAVAMENQTLPYGLGSLWAGAGAKWSWRGVCACVTQVPNSGDREHDIYWWTGPDNSRILMKWNTLFANDSLGGYAEARRPLEAINLADTNAAFFARYPYPVIGIFGKGWDDLQTLTNEFVTTAQNATNANRQIIVSNEQDFFQDFETNHSANLPSVTCTFGNEWELYCASLAEVSAGVKRSVEKLRSAEALTTLVSLQDPSFLTSRIAARDQAFVNLGLYWEHDWTGDGSVSRTDRANWQRTVASGIASYVDTLFNDARSSLGGLIRKTGTNTRFYVFNPLSWTRTDYADYPWTDTNPVHVVDTTNGQEVPSQIITLDGTRYLRVLTSNIPSVGYKVYEIVPGTGQAFSDAATYSGGYLENSVYRVAITNTGTITVLQDKLRANREFARAYGIQAINDMGAGRASSPVIENAGPVSVTIRTDTTSGLLRTTRITVFRDSTRLEIRNDINQNFGDVQTNAFGFNIDSPDIWHEEVGAVIRAKKVAAGGHYSDRTQNSRYDWQTLNHFVDVNGGGVGITLSNADCYYMKIGNSTTSTLDTNTAQIKVLLGGQVDGINLGIQNQGGDTHFRQRFALQTHDTLNKVAAMRFSLEHQNPLVTGPVTGGSAYPETTYTALTISDPNLLLWSVKPAEEGIGQGIIVRAWNVSDTALNGTLSLAQPVATAKATTHIETDLNDASVTNESLNISTGQRQIQTYRLNIKTLVAGRIDLQGCRNLVQNLQFQFRPVGGGTPIDRNVTLTSNGSFRILDIPVGGYNLAIKGSKWLRKVVPVNVTQGGTFGVTALLFPGDLNGDNAVSLADYSLFKAAYGSTPTSGNWNPNADLNCDDAVSLADYALFKSNYGKVGDL